MELRNSLVFHKDLIYLETKHAKKYLTLTLSHFQITSKNRRFVEQLDGINFTMYDNYRAKFQSKYEKMDILSQTEETFTSLYMDLSRYLLRYIYIYDIYIYHIPCVWLLLCVRSFNKCELLLHLSNLSSFAISLCVCICYTWLTGNFQNVYCVACTFRVVITMNYWCFTSKVKLGFFFTSNM